MIGPLAIGMGCRRAWPAEAIADLIERACRGLDRAGARLFTHAVKADDPSVAAVARQLELPLVFLSNEVLEAALAGVTVRSARVASQLGIPSVAEAAALGGAGPGARLIVPRMSDGGATCAVAAVERTA